MILNIWDSSRLSRVKFIVPIESPLVSYLTSFVSDVVSLTVFEIRKSCDIDLGQFKVMVRSDSPWMVSYSTSTSIIVSVTSISGHTMAVLHCSITGAQM